MAKIKQNAFTIVELLVAMTLLVILLGLSGLVFNTSVKAFRAGSATVEMTRNLRALTEQLSADLQGIRTDAPLFIAFNYDSADDRHYDTIHFFANGDFQTTGQYNDGSGLKTVSGNMARIYYGHANTSGTDYADNHILARKAHILTSDAGIKAGYPAEIPPVSDWPTTPPVLDYDLFDNAASGFGMTDYYISGYPDENMLEFNTITLTNWANALNYLDAGADGIFGTIDDVPDNADAFITNCMTDAARPMIDLSNPNTLHLLMSQGLLQMQIQWAYTNDDLIVPGTGLPPVSGFEGVRWWPSDDPAGDASDVSDFTTMSDQFGVHFNLAASSVAGWFLSQNSQTEYNGTVMNFSDTFYPRALKFTFLVKDAKGVFNEGKTFTHIVYIGD